MEKLEEVLSSYGIYPLEMGKVTELVTYVSDSQHRYALKKSSLTKQMVSNWENVYHQANAKNLAAVLPVYLTKQGNLFQEANEHIYYLTPWIEHNDEKQSIKHIYQSLAKIHANTKQTQSIESEKIIAQFNTYKASCNESHLELLAYVEQFEKNRYMSPFELVVCTHYRDLEHCFKEMQKRIDQFVEEQETQASWNFCLCHGNLERFHILQSKQTYFINWESARYDNPIIDLSMLFSQLSIYYDEEPSLFIDQFKHYMNDNELSKDELYLLSIYLLDQKKYMALIRNYADKTTSLSTIEQISALQQTYRQLQFGLEFSKFVEREYDILLFDDLESLS